jgi:hypothetical protein
MPSKSDKPDNVPAVVDGTKDETGTEEKGKASQDTIEAQFQDGDLPSVSRQILSCAIRLPLRL